MATRAASKLEDQMTMLLEKMDKQSEQLQNLTRQQSERVDSIAQKQQETEEHVHAIEGDLHAVKTTVDGRLSAVEGSLTGLRTELQSELLERQERLRKELHDDLLREFSTPTGLEGGLRPTAPPFVPATTATTGGEAGTVSAHTGSSPTTSEGGTLPGVVSAGDIAVPDRGTVTAGATQQRLAPFDGKSAWDVYRAQFELLASLNKWSNADEATHLAISLRGAAATVLMNLHPAQRQSYEALSAALESRFGTAHQTELNRMRLKARSRRRDETLAELAEDVERLVHLAYPEATEAMVEVLAKDQFVDALPEEDMRLRIRQNKPVMLRDALRLALELESYQLASRQRPKLVRETHLEGSLHQQQTTTPGATLPTDVLQQLVQAIQQCGKEPRRGRNSRKSQRPAPSGLICWECKEKGHKKRECPRLQTGQPGDRTVTRPGNGQ